MVKYHYIAAQCYSMQYSMGVSSMRDLNCMRDIDIWYFVFLLQRIAREVGLMKALGRYSVWAGLKTLTFQRFFLYYNSAPPSSPTHSMSQHLKMIQGEERERERALKRLLFIFQVYSSSHTYRKLYQSGGLFCFHIWL